MKIVVTGTRGIPDIMGGVETHCEELFPRIAAMGHDVTVIRRSCYVTENNRLATYKGVKLKDVYAPRKKSLEAIVHTFLAVIEAKRLKADVVHIHAIGPSLMVPFARLLGLKVVTTHHGPDYDRKKWGRFAKLMLQLGERNGAMYSNEVIVISRVIADILKTKYNRDSNLIFNGVNTPHVSGKTGYIDSIGLSDGKYVLAVGRFVKEKGFDMLIDAFVKAGMHDFKLVIAGDADHEDEYSLMLKRKALDNGVVLTGFVKGEKLSQLLAHAALFVLPSFHEGLPIKRDSNIKASVTIMNGCNNFCTYCIVPYVRGRERSREPKEIIKEVEELAKQGYKEITLLGQNVNSYLRVEKEKGKPFEEYEGVHSFATLLEAINKIEGIERIRFVSPHPKDFTDDVIEAIANCDKVCKLVHLPLQSGNTKVLKEMNRKYTKEQYLNLVEKMKAKIPNLTLSTDIIVGFPGETEEEFEDTLDVVRKVRFEQVYMFIYSRRVGTPGDKMENQIPEEVKHKRFDRLKALVESQIEENNQKYVGTIQKVLVEGTSKNNEKMLTGRTDSNKVVIFEGDKSLINQMIDLKIVSEHMWYLKGE